MTPLLALLLGLAATAAGADNAYRRELQLNSLRRRLGMWPTNGYPGSIARRLDWIQRTFGVDAALLSARVADLLGEKLITKFHEHVSTPKDMRAATIAPFLPWFAWRLSKGDVPQEIVAVLRHPAYNPQIETDEGEIKAADYGRDQAWETLTQLVDWAGGARPDIFRYTWAQAIAAEKAWYPTTLPSYTMPGLSKGDDPITLPPGEIKYIFPQEDEEGRWTVQRFDDLDDTTTIRQMFRHRTTTSREVMDVLRRPDGEPVVMMHIRSRTTWDGRVVSYPNVLEISGEYGSRPIEWMGDKDEWVTRVHTYLEHEFGHPDNWGEDGQIIALLVADEKGAEKLLKENPEWFTEHGVGGTVAYNVGDMWEYSLVEKWGELANANPREYSYLPANVAETQHPSRRVIEWMVTGEAKDALADIYLTPGEFEERWPEVFHEYVYDPRTDNPDADINSSSDEESSVMPWEIKIWDIYTAPGGEELEIKVQILVFYDGQQWTGQAKIEGQYRPNPDDSTTWETSDGFNDFKFVDIVEDNHGYKELDTSILAKISRYDNDFEEIVTTTSLDEALMGAWEYFTEGLDNADIGDEKWRNTFREEDLVEPGPNIEIQDVFEVRAMLGL